MKNIYQVIRTDDELFQELLRICETPKPKFEIYQPKTPIEIGQDEEWRIIEGFHYSISNYGRIRNDKTKRIKEVRFRRWELKTDIYQDGKRYMVNIKRMVAECFVAFRKLKENERVKCIDGNSKNTYYKNLKVVNI